MRDYSKVSGAFWTGRTGKALRGKPQLQLTALYLMTSPHANMIGVFQCPLIYISHETGSPLEGATESLWELVNRDFCTYHEDTEMVWVHEMARFQIADALKPGDLRISGIQKMYESLSVPEIKAGFFERYGAAFHLVDNKPLSSPLPAPTKPEAGTGTGTGRKPSVAKATSTSQEFEAAWKTYPKRSGNNPKADAWKAWNARTSEGVTVDAMVAGMGRYAAWCEATDKLGTEMVMQAATFFGPSRRFEQEFTLPRTTAKAAAAWKANDATIEAKAREVGASTMGCDRITAIARVEEKMAELR